MSLISKLVGGMVNQMSLSRLELERYNRQIMIDGWGPEGQRKLKDSKVAVVGIGGLGCVSSIFLAAAGVGKIRLVDEDKSCLTDLNRQILYSVNDIGRLKIEAAKEKIHDLNPEIDVETVPEEITEDTAPRVLRDVDIMVDGLDNWKTRFIVNDYCVKQNVPFIHAGVSEFYGQITTIMPRKGPCLRCIFPKQPAETQTVAVFGATAAVLASLQVMEVIKLIIGKGKPLIGRILFIDGEEMTFETVQAQRNPKCPACGFS